VTWIERTGYPRLSRMVSTRDLDEVFTPTADELSWAQARTASEQHFLALVVLLKCHQRLGYFPRLGQVPVEVVDHIRGAAKLGASIEARHESNRTLWRHREWIRTRLDVVFDAARVRGIAEGAMREALLSKDNPADVINVALEKLTQQHCELPGYTTLDEMAASIRAQVNGGFHRLVANRVDALGRVRLLELLIVDPLRRRSGLAELTQPAPKATVTRLRRIWRFCVGWMRWGPPRSGWAGSRRRRSRTSPGRLRCWMRPSCPTLGRTSG
jgi:hypothetical protein